MKIVSIEKTSGRQERARITFAGGEQVELAQELLLTGSIRVGATLLPARLEEMLQEDLRWRAREMALRLLSHRPRTESELRLRMLRKDIPVTVVEACVAELREKGLLDDTAFAEMFTRDRVRLNPRGRQRLVQELRGRGVETEIAAAAVEGVMQEESLDEIALARDSARRWRARAGEEPAHARRRLMGFLARRGFGAEAVRQVVRETLGEE